MKISVSKIVLLGAVFATGSLAVTSAAVADYGLDARMYRVTVMNATRGQPVAPSVIATHTDAFRLFELGPTPAAGDVGYDYYFALATNGRDRLSVPPA